MEEVPILKRNQQYILSAGDTTARRDYCVWDLLCLPDGTLASADSDGAVQFWDGATGTLLRRFTQHAADVLRLVASPDGATVFAAGVDPQIAVFQLVPASAGGCSRLFSQSPRAGMREFVCHSMEPDGLCGIVSSLPCRPGTSL